LKLQEFLELTDFSEHLDFSVLRNRGSPRRKTRFPRCFHPFLHDFRELRTILIRELLTCELITHELPTYTNNPPVNSSHTNLSPVSNHTREFLTRASVTHEPHTAYNNVMPPTPRMKRIFFNIMSKNPLTTYARPCYHSYIRAAP
jgi:hypothetical protein